MACERSQDLDLSAFLAAPRDREFEEFRDHYPRCRECSAEVRAWTELHEALAAPHPEPEQLARYQALPAAERAPLDLHLAGCPACREELAQLAAFEPAPLRAPAPPAEPRRSWLAGLGRIVWSPAFAYGVALLLMIPLAQRLPSQDAQAPLAEQVFAESVPIVVEMEQRPRADADLRLEESKKDEAAAPARKQPAPQAPREVAERELADEVATAEEAVVLELEADDFARNAPAQGDAKQKAFEPAPMASFESHLGGKSSGRREGGSSAFAQGAGRASAVASMDALAPSNVVRLESHRTARVPVPDSPLRISVPLPPGTMPGDVWVRVVSADGRRELRERVAEAVDGRVEISVPGEWLRAGSYRVELEGASYAFEVAEPSSPRSSSSATP